MTERVIGRQLMRCVCVGAILLRFTMAPFAGAEETSTTFERHIRPILKARCFQCHGEDGKREGGLDLRLRRFIVQGGESGPAVVVGRPDESYLLERIRLGEMPPDDDAKKLSADEIALIAQWIATGAQTARPEPERIEGNYFISEEDRGHWSFQPIARPAVPKMKSTDRCCLPVDAFLLARLDEQGQSFSPETDRRTLIRRAYFDLVGLPPSPDDVAAFLADESPDAYERLIDRLLASSHYGERWGRHWLDMAGYADSQGATGDDPRPYAYRYRDYVIRSFNADKPFDQFIREQLAGDEMVGPISGSPTAEQAEMLIATGFLQMAPDGTATAEDALVAHDQLVADTIEIVSSSLLGLTVGCARCHDHRYDPIGQDDYYRFRAIFEPALARRNWQGRRRLIAYSTEQDQQNAESLLRQQEQAIVQRVVEQQLAMLQGDQQAVTRAAYETPESERSEAQKQLLVDSRLNITAESIRQFDRPAGQELQRLRARFASGQERFLQTIREAGGRVSRTFLFVRGDPRVPEHELQPGELAVLEQDAEVDIPSDDPALASTGRRLAYVRHLTDGSHPLLARVIVNRVWMHHFGRGLCATPADFGLQGDPPSHPNLLDWLAAEFVAPADGQPGWSLKHLHKSIMTSMAYRQGVHRNEALQRIDPDNRLLGGFNTRRLEAEIVRDAILAISGTLNHKPFGTAVPVMRDPAGEIVIGRENTNAGIPLAVVPMFGEEGRRSVYVQVRRTMPMTFLQMFDAPAMEPNCKVRSTSTVAPQSLVLMNSPLVLEQSLRFAERVRQEVGADPPEQAARAWKLAYSREPTPEELADAIAFLKARADYFRLSPPEPPKRSVVPGSRAMRMQPHGPDVLIDLVSKTDPELLALALLCQMLISSNEFLYVS